MASPLGLVERVNDAIGLIGNLRLIDPQTWLTSQELVALWADKDKGTVIDSANTANMSVYRIVDGKVILNFFEKKGNLFLESQYRDEVAKIIIQGNDKSGGTNSILEGNMLAYVNEAIKEGHTVEIPYSGLRLRPFGTDAVLDIRQGLNNADEQRLIQAVYGEVVPKDMTRITLMGETDIKEILKGNEDKALVRACFMNKNLFFLAGDPTIHDKNSAVYGVRSHMQNGNMITDAYNLVLGNLRELTYGQAAELRKELNACFPINE